MDRNELPLEPRQLRVPSGASKMISNPMVHLVQTMHLSSSNTNTVMERTETRFHMSHHHLGVLLASSKMISKPMVRLVQTVYLSSIKISTISERTKLKFHLCLVTLEYNRVHPKRLLILWYVWHKPCTYLAPTLTPSPNGLKQDSP
jgi:hypothetical protein